MSRLLATALSGLIKLLAVMLACLFVPAWTLRYWQAWVFVGVFAGSSAAATWYLYKNDPELLRRRLTAGPGAEKQRSQQIVQVVASAAFVSFLILPSLDFRYGWSVVPLPIVLAGDLLVALGFAVVLWTFKENSYASAIVETVEHQRVITSGPYAIVRHPMYAGAIVMLVGTPLALGSYWALLVLLPMTAAIIWRLLDEERLLERELPGYAEYRVRVRYRLVPLVW
jgi:protein-S-isoprenylcysteine O-methyltransferase Ste14